MRERSQALQDEKDAEREASRLNADMDGDAESDDDNKIEGEISAMHRREEKTKKRAEKKMIDRKLLQAERLGYNPAV